MSYTSAPRKGFRGVALILALVVTTTAASGVAAANVSEVLSISQISDLGGPPQQQEAEDKEPEANLPFLFAVFFITWAAFFAYVFLMSRRLRDMRREIDTLKRALAERQQRSPPAGPDPPSREPHP